MNRALGSLVLVVCFVSGLTFALASFPATSSPAPSFATAGEYTTSYPRSLAFGDLDGDGRPDLVSADAPFESGQVAIFRNRGDGRFEPRGTYATAGSSWSSAIGDLNGDRKPDVVTANSRFEAGSVSVLLNEGDGTFRAGGDYETGQGAHSVAVGDLTGDAKPDLVTANSLASTVSVLVNRGDGTFSDRVDSTTGSGPYGVGVGDLNGDGRLDVVTANHGNHGPTWEKTVSVLIGNGDGSFRPERQYQVGLGPLSVMIADVTGDGRPDVVTANTFSNSVSVLQNAGDGTFSSRLDYATGRGPQQLAVADLDGDGRLDLATANYFASVLGDKGTFSVLLNKGHGAFYSKLDYPTGIYPQAIAVGDVNGDSRPDVATNVRHLSVTVQLNSSRTMCTVQDLWHKTRPAAKQLIVRSNCGVGRIRWRYSRVDPRGRVVVQTQSAGKVLPKGTKIGFTVSRGPR